jgi:hypothetical protein
MKRMTNMDTTTETPNAEPPRKGRFQKGVSGNPKGKPKGQTAKTKIRELLSKGDIEDIVAKLAAKAKEGCVASANILLARAYPVPKAAGRMLSGFQLPVLKTAEDVANALAVVVECISRSLLTLEEANNLSALIERQGAALAASDHEKRLLALEAANAPKMIGRGSP